MSSDISELLLIHPVEGSSEDRGVFARGAISAGDAVLLRARPAIAVLYSPHHTTRCAHCFVERGTEDGWFSCASCSQYLLCPRCARDAPEDAIPDPALAVPQEADRPPLKEAHTLACAWYAQLPADVTAPAADTDLLRFCLEYAARVQLGEESLRRALWHALKAGVPSAEVKEFCRRYAVDLVLKTFGPPANSSGSPSATTATSAPPYMTAVTGEELTEVLLRTRTNSLGFPFDADQTLGWSLHPQVCMINHSCDPNACFAGVAQDETQPGYLTLQAKRPIKSGEEITISYVDVPTYAADVRARSRALLEKYHFLCRCDVCLSQRAALKATKT